jgi:hypothetical protein
MYHVDGFGGGVLARGLRAGERRRAGAVEVLT